MVSKKLVGVWEQAYRRYMVASEAIAERSPDAATVREMALTSHAVASAWRGIAADWRLPWWAKAAAESAAEAFDCQARHWRGRINERNNEQDYRHGVQRPMDPGAERGRGHAHQWFEDASGGAGGVPGPRQFGDPAAYRSDGVAGVRPAPSPAQRRLSGHGGLPGERG
ncbi:hypothetical protein [Amycolatopsis cihanbeyliensis]|uniref:hypothetical protein n=1 Tax=Amycolatopsis cihanbeyliensis TaxID=1128664 RepID=UPI0014769A5F|nr:hypothetical protein [Amycolatopsis cihanbeyliensis]